MGIRLDWEVEAEQSTTHSSSEDKRTARRRRAARLRLFLGIGVLLALFGAVYGLVRWRLNIVNGEIERALRDTVIAEVTTLRISDRTTYLSIQESADPNWKTTQENLFNQYQQIKTTYNVQLTGSIVSVEIDGPRGRVQVEEIIDGVPYVQTWFYWRFSEGWRHVPPDYTFWGETDTLEQRHISVRYQGVDAALAEAMAPAVNGWIDRACAVLTCANIAPIEADIIPRPGMPLAWDETNPWRLQIPSPYVGRTRLDRPFDVPLQIELANVLTGRLIGQALGTVEPGDTSGAYYLRDAVSRWLIGGFTQTDTDSHLLSSYTARYGDAALGEILRTLPPTADITVLNGPAGVSSLHELAVDWRDYLTWRLSVENELITRRDEATFIALYDTRLPEATDLAFQRFAAGQTTPGQVVSVQASTQPDGTPALDAVVFHEGEEQIVQFRLADGVWKRAN